MLGTVLSRPSKVCKSPYVADVVLENGTKVLAHAPSLGCGGLCDRGAKVYLRVSTGTSKVCTHSIEASQQPGCVVSVNPKDAEEFIDTCLRNSLIERLSGASNIQRETSLLHSRFDFSGVDGSGRPFVLEVKSVPLSEGEIAYFPSYSKKGLVSPRALKHIQELTQLLSQGYRCILCFVVTREDATCFKLNERDTLYREAVLQAHQCGVEIMVVQFRWTPENMIYVGELPWVTI
jgi:sugar fermentation stimulation protein A